MVTDKLYVCPKGHISDAVLHIIVEDTGSNLDVLPYAGSYCFVCYAAWIAANVPRVETKEIEVPAE